MLHNRPCSFIDVHLEEPIGLDKMLGKQSISNSHKLNVNFTQYPVTAAPFSKARTSTRSNSFTEARIPRRSSLNSQVLKPLVHSTESRSTKNHPIAVAKQIILRPKNSFKVKCFSNRVTQNQMRSLARGEHFADTFDMSVSPPKLVHNSSKKSNLLSLLLSTRKETFSHKPIKPCYEFPDSQQGHNFVEEQSKRDFPTCTDSAVVESVSRILDFGDTKGIQIVLLKGSTPVLAFGKQSTEHLQIASLTKIMTCFLALRVVKKFDLLLDSQKTVISKKASSIGGTSAGLMQSHIFSIHDLLHALMLPSGNDAALAIAEWAGKLMKKRVNQSQSFKREISSLKYQKPKSAVKLFVYHMNKTAKSLGLFDTYFANPHGLFNPRAYSHAEDVTRLSIIAMQDSAFKKIVATKQYQCSSICRFPSALKLWRWNNTNKLLEQGFTGIKTGVTPQAGPCLVSHFNVTPDQSVVITLLQARSLQGRFSQAIKILISFLEAICSSTAHAETFQAIKQLRGQLLYQVPPTEQQTRPNIDLNEAEYESCNDLQV